MALEKCTIGSPSANIAPDCDNPWVAGLLDTAVAFAFSDITLAFDATNKRKITGYTVKSGAKPFAIYADEKMPFADAAVAVNTETRKNTYNKTFPFFIPLGGADDAKNVIDPIVQSTEGFIIFAKTKNKVADGAVIVFGAHTGCKCTEGARNYTDPALEGAFKATMVETGSPYETVTYVGDEVTPTYAVVMSDFDTLLGLVP